MTVGARFPRSDRIRVEMPTRSTATATARMLDRLQQPVQIPSTGGDRPDFDESISVDCGGCHARRLAPVTAIETTLSMGVKQVTAFQLVP